LRTGSIAFFDAPEPVLWFERREGSQSLQALFNLGDESVSVALREALVPLPGHPHSPQAGARVQARGDSSMLTLPPYGVFFGRPASEEQM
jgi:alpha-glucosidase